MSRPGCEPLQQVQELEQLKKELQESEKNFKELAEMLPEAIFESDTAVNLTYVNQRALSLFGYTRQDFENGLNGIELLIPEDRERARRNIKRRLAGELAGASEYKALKKDGSIFQVLLNANPIIRQDTFKGLRGVIVDISELKRAEEKISQQSSILREKNEELSALSAEKELVLNLVPGIICTAGIDGYFKSVNPALEKILGFSRAELLNRPLMDFVHPEDKYPVKKELGRFGDRRIRLFENRYLCRDGSYRLLEWITTSAVDGILYAMGRDITEQRQAEVEREKLIVELRKALAEIKTLRGIIPICMYCKKIKRDEEIWDQLENYLAEHSDADFSHGICPDCYQKQLEELKKEN